MNDPREIRREIRRARGALDPVKRTLFSRALCARLATLIRPGKTALYLPVRGEIDPTPLLHRFAARSNYSFFLPVLVSGRFNRLLFLPYRAGDPLRRSRLGILEPLYRPRRAVTARSLDLIIMPLLAFDAEGNRLGAGGGFYDRTLAFMRHRLRWRRPRLIGVGYDFQSIAKLPVNPWDVPLDGVVTNADILYFSSKSGG